MVNIDYIQRKFASLAGEAQREISQAAGKARGEAIRRSGGPSTRIVFVVQDVIRSGFRTVLEKMAKVMIDLGAQNDAASHAAFSTATADLIKQLVPVGSFVLGKGLFQLTPQSQVQKQEEEFRVALTGLAQQTLDDASNKIVGDQAHGGTAHISVTAHNAAIATGQGAVAQAGDHAQQQVQQGNVAELSAIIAELMRLLPADQADAKAKAKAVEDAIEAKSPGRIRQAVNALRGALSKMSDAGLVEIVKRLADWLGG